MPRVALFLLALGAAAQPEHDLLEQVRARMLEHVTRQPNYTCLETVERSRLSPGGGLLVQDTLRLEVALVDGKEMFAWPGATQFEDKDLRELVSTGMFGNGSYALYARMLFGPGGPAFRFAGEARIAGQPMLRYSFRVPQRNSGYRVSVGRDEAVVGYHGAVYLEPARGDLRRIEIHADDIPPRLGLQVAEDRVDYARVLIGDEEFLLPVESELHMAGAGVNDRNRVRFSNCRKFAGESALIFDDPEFLDAPETPVETRPVELPADLLLSLELRENVRLEDAAVGDRVTAVLRGDLKRGREVLAPKGAIAKGRIVRLDRLPGQFVLAIHFEELEWRGGHARLRARFERRGGIDANPRVLALDQANDGMVIPSGSRSHLRGLLMFYRTVP
jgi:hypothetical protein